MARKKTAEHKNTIHWDKKKLIILIVLFALGVSGAGGFLYYQDVQGKKVFQKDQKETPTTEPDQESTDDANKEAEEERKKEIERKLDEVRKRLHTQGSGQHLRDTFRDLEVVYEDYAPGQSFFPKYILPFRYNYSPEADYTFNVCAIDLTVFMCKGKLDRLIEKGDINSGRCEVVSIYLQDPRLK